MRMTQEELNQRLAENKDLRVAGQASTLTAVPLSKTNKYHVAAKEDRTLNGRTYASKKEMLYAQELELRVKAGDIDFWLEQIPFRLPGGTTYRLDFMTFKARNNEPYALTWTIEYIEVKGKDLRLGQIKRRQAEELFGIEIKVV